jgi:hypothetical protein
MNIMPMSSELTSRINDQSLGTTYTKITLQLSKQVFGASVKKSMSSMLQVLLYCNCFRRTSKSRNFTTKMANRTIPLEASITQ